MFLPEMDLLCLYKEMGGEILTIGSDAHRSENVFSFIMPHKDVNIEICIKGGI